MDKKEQIKQVMLQRENRIQHKQQLDRLTSLEKTLVSSLQQLVKFLDGKTTKTEVVNQLQSIRTPDTDKVVSALERLDSSVKGGKLDISPLVKGLDALEKQLKELPKSFPEAPEQLDTIKVSNLKELDIDGLKKAINGLELKAPDVNVSAPEVKVEAPDLEPLKKSILTIVDSIKAIKFPETDLNKVEKHLDEANKKLQKIIDKPMGGGGGGGGNGTPYTDSTGRFVYVELTPDGKIPVEAGVTFYESRFDTTSTASAVYLGDALPGSSETDAVWQITKVNTATGSITFADNETTYTKVWNDRTTYGY